MGGLCNMAGKYAPLVGRMLLALLFLQSGWHKTFDFGGNVRVMTAKGIPLPEILLAATIILVVAGGLMLLFGWYARWAALGLFVWMIPVTLLFHAFWTVEPGQVFNQTNHFLKNLAIMGALLMVIGMGTGPFSLDNRRSGVQGPA